MTYDDQFLLTASGDGSLLVWKIVDKEGRGLRDKEFSYTEEILITKTDLEEKVWGAGGLSVSVCVEVIVFRIMHLNVCYIGIFGNICVLLRSLVLSLFSIGEILNQCYSTLILCVCVCPAEPQHARAEDPGGGAEDGEGVPDPPW